MFSFYTEKRAHFFHFQGAHFFYATLMLMHETPKTGPVQVTFTCSKSTVKPVENGVKYVSKLTTQTPERNLNIFHTFSSDFIVDFQQVNVSWVVLPIYFRSLKNF